jgi:hypothetical protein
MTQEHENQKEPVGPNPPGVTRLQFAKDNAFQVELQRRVDKYFRSTGRRKRDCWQMYLKTALVLVCFAKGKDLRKRAGPHPIETARPVMGFATGWQ